MSKPITDDEIRQMKARERLATKGPWNDRGEHGVTQTTHITRDVWQIPRTEDDVAFIAHAREFVPRVIADLEAKTNQVERLRTDMERIKEVANDRFLRPRDVRNKMVGLAKNALAATKAETP